jgi:hypothetical protein
MLKVAEEICTLEDVGFDGIYKKFVVKNEYKLNTLMPKLKDYPDTEEGEYKYEEDLKYFKNKYSHNLKKDDIGINSFIFPKKFLKLRYNKK